MYVIAQLGNKRRKQNREWMMASFQSNVSQTMGVRAAAAVLRRRDGHPVSVQLQRLLRESPDLQQCAHEMQHQLVNRSLGSGERSLKFL